MIKSINNQNSEHVIATVIQKHDRIGSCWTATSPRSRLTVDLFLVDNKLHFSREVTSCNSTILILKTS
jgi:hypothetical protein